MNLSSSLKTLTTKQYQLTAKQRSIVIVAIGIMAIIIAMYATTSEVAVESTLPGNDSQQTADPSSKSVIPMGNQVTQVNQVDQIIRDPFAQPPEAKDGKSQIDHVMPTVQSAAPSMVSKKVVSSVPIPHENLRLTGIVGNADRRLAVIMSANKSQSYSLHDVIGTYKIVAINEDSVILTNATGKLVLRLESAGQKEG